MNQPQGKNLAAMTEAELQQLIRNMEIRQAQLQAANDVRSKYVGQPSGAVQYMKNLTQGDGLAINNVIWPFNFVPTPKVLAPGAQDTTSFQVTMEAAFVWTSLVKVVFDVDLEAPTIEYINPQDVTGNNSATGLRIQLSDGSSGRTYVDGTLPLDQIGTPTQPFLPDRPMMFAPLQILEISLFNQNPTRTFVPFLIFQGYRIRLEGQQDLMNFVTGI